MDIQNIVEGNKLIAEFMGVPYIHKYGFREQMGYEYIDDDGGKVWWSENHLKYDWDWSWLMPVVEKIESLEFLTKIASIERVEYPNNEKRLHIVSISNTLIDITTVEKNIYKINAVYECVVKFIQWYQQNQKPR